MLKRHRSNVVELLPDDVVELILERLPVQSLLRFKSLSKTWKSTIESQCFWERQLIRRRQSRGPDVLLVSLRFLCDDVPNKKAQRIVLGSSIVSTVRFPTSGSRICHGSCDGLLCLHGVRTPSVVVNPATRWHQSFPLSNLQQLLVDSLDKQEYYLASPMLGFGKDKFTGTYKPVLLYNSSVYGLYNVTTCEVFDFSTNAWRYVHPSSPYRINDNHNPVYLDGSLHWLTEDEETKKTKVLTFDLHTETFQVLCKAPFARERDTLCVIMCILDNRLCVSEQNWPTQVIWSLNSSGGNKTWKKMCSIDLRKTLKWFNIFNFPLEPIAILDKNKLLLQGRNCLGNLVIHDLHAKSYDLLFSPETRGYPVYYYQSLFSV